MVFGNAAVAVGRWKCGQSPPRSADLNSGAERPPVAGLSELVGVLKDSKELRT